MTLLECFAVSPGDAIVSKGDNEMVCHIGFVIANTRSHITVLWTYDPTSAYNANKRGTELCTYKKEDTWLQWIHRYDLIGSLHT